ncbi:T-complex protein 1 subunit theta-like 2 [Ctenodactylus gundi]
MDRPASSVLALPQRLEKSPRHPPEGQQPLLSSLAAVQTLATVIRPCYGPHGRQKFLVSASGAAVCTGSPVAILRALQLEHPAARLVREAAQAQAEDSGDGVAFVVLLAEALLAQAESLLRAGLPRPSLREAFSSAAAQALATLPSLAIRSLGPLEDPSWALYAAINTHTLSHPEHLAKLVAQACWVTKEPAASVRPERVGVCTLRGGTPGESCLIPGLAIAASPCGQMAAVLSGARVALFACPFGSARPNTPAATQLSSLKGLAGLQTEGSQAIAQEVVRLARAEINVAVVWGDVDGEALAEADRCGIMVIGAASRRELRYLSDVLGTPVMTQLLPPPRPGTCHRVYRQELGRSAVVVFEGAGAGTPALTVVLRGATAEGLRGSQEAVYHGLDAYCQLCQDPRLLPGAGATEMALARMLSDQGGKLDGPAGPAFLAVAQALRSLPKTLAENAGLDDSCVMAEMRGLHQAGDFLVGVGAEGLINAAQNMVWDTFTTRARGLRAAVEVVLQLVTVDTILVARKSPVPQPSLDPDSADEGKHLSSEKKHS